MDNPAFALALTLVALLVGFSFARKYPQLAPRTENEPEIIPADVGMMTDAIRRQAERIGDLERRGSERDVELADALDRFARMTQRLAVRADRAERENPSTGDLAHILARRNGVR